MSNLTDLLPAGAGGKQVSFVASGTIGDGVTVALNSDGTVEAVAITQSFGSPTLFTTNWVADVSSVYDSANGKVVVVYRAVDNSNYGTAVVGTVSGTSISFGTPVVFISAASQYQSSTYDSANGKVVIAYRDNTNLYGKAIVGTVSGTSISFGTSVTFNSSDSTEIASTYDSANGKVVIAFKERAISPAYGRAIVGTVSGTSISFGSEATFFTLGDANLIIATYDSANGKVVLGASSSSAYNATVGTVSGTSISFGSLVQAVATSTDWVTSVYDPNSATTIIFYRDYNNSNYGTAVVGTVSGTSISFGTPVVFESGATLYPYGIYYPIDGTIVVVYTDGGNSNRGTLVIGTVSGTSVSFGSPTVFQSKSGTFSTRGVYDTNNQKIAIVYGDNTLDGEGLVYQPPISNNTDFIGISDSAISDTASGSVTIKGGISTNVTGLTANSTYYVQTNGTLSTTVSSVLAGKALSSTSINLDYTT